MGIDNLEEEKDASSSAASAEQAAGQAGAGDPDPNNPTRMDAAKAFFRAMYAGDEGEEEEGKPAAAGSPGSPGEGNRRVDQLLQQAEQRAVDAEGNYKRLMADFDNFRRRMEREREDYTNIGIKKAADALIQGLDDLDRALLYLTPETPAEKVIESFKLVGTRIFACLEQTGIKRMATKGVEFDPRLHEPVMSVDSDEAPDNTIVQELRAGYFIGDKVLRAALVSVASNPNIPAPSVQAARAEAAAAKAAEEAAAAAAKAAAEEAAKVAAERAAKLAAEKAAAEEAALNDISPVPELESSSPPPRTTTGETETPSSTTGEKPKPRPKKEADDLGVYDLGDLDDV